MKEQRKNENVTKTAQTYAHNPAFCMIRPGAEEEEDVVSTGSS